VSLFRVLLVDDFEPWRRFLSSALENYPLIRVVGEASDGLEAIRVVKSLKPDLVLLDIGLPKRNGLEVAREILKFSPSCKILFVTQESSREIAEEGLRLGGQGYLLKADAGVELLAAVEAILQNKLFISRSCKDEPLGGGKPAVAVRATSRLPGSVHCKEH
jgi:DNA-binding NarL/FixJ family response regulator